MEDESPFIDYIENFNYHIGNAVKTANRLQTEFHREIERDVEDFFQSYECLWPYEGCQVFGSRLAGLASDDSDFDIYVQTDYCDNDLLYDIWNCLKDSYSFTPLQFVKKLNFIRVLHKDTGIRCDLVFNDDYCEAKSDALADWLNIQRPEARKFAIFIRDWFSMSSFGNGYNKMLDMLSVFWMIKKNVLPPFRECVQDSNDSTSFQVEINDTDYYDLNEMYDFRNYIKGFFNFYGSFDWANKIVCPYTGTAEYKNCILDNNGLNWRDDIYNLNVNKPMIVLSFFNLSSNFAARAGKNKVAEFVKFCRQSQSLFQRFTNFP